MHFYQKLQRFHLHKNEQNNFQSSTYNIVHTVFFFWKWVQIENTLCDLIPFKGRKNSDGNYLNVSQEKGTYSELPIIKSKPEYRNDYGRNILSFITWKIRVRWKNFSFVTWKIERMVDFFPKTAKRALFRVNREKRCALYRKFKISFLICSYSRIDDTLGILLTLKSYVITG